MRKTGNLLSDLPEGTAQDEIFDTLAMGPGMRIERIVSTGQVTAEGEWYDQDDDEWVVVIAGAARLKIEGEDDERRLGAGDWIHLPAHCRHRVTWTQESPPTVWLAVHYEAAG
ncbi:cupin domain-containing protein [Hoeflea poritis]|uniref:Cupin domain-containing protein n=1 Tax=Hoeflea poritis TaxID=2993659 RepID=A0ABT4VGV1_9HYPH|nr:cupin domain-containing protein [Hoeflea poritis]MDA4843931.1 cupin domain-containing protein [Hoeflea poritis]